MLKHLNKKLKIVQNQQGLVAITVTLIIMIIITLVVTSFSLIVRQEQRQSLDRQLSTQAFYAAEVGVEHARDALTRNPNLSATNCNDFKANTTPAGGTSPYNPQISANVSYTCALIDNKPTSWKASGLNPKNGAIVVPIKATGDLRALRISWQTDGVTSFGRSGADLYKFPAGPGTLETGAVRITMVKGSDLSRNALVDSTQTMYFYPNQSSDIPETIDYNPPSQSRKEQGQIVEGRCSNSPVTPLKPKFCNADINIADAKRDSNNNYYLFIKPLYQTISMEIAGFNGPIGSGATDQLKLEGVQAVIDVTGKAQDVLRRVQVRIPITAPSQSRPFDIVPDAALETTDTICKRLEVGISDVTDNCVNPNP